MPPRYAYWTIILDGAPTSFRTKERDDILPLFNQFKAKNPGALLKWFSGGRLWDSPEQAKDVRDVEKVRKFREERAKDTKEQRELEEREMRAFREKHGRPADGSDQKPPEDVDSSRGAFAPREGRPPAPPWSPGASAPGSPKAPREDRRESRPPSDRRSRDWRPGGEHRDPRDKYKLPPGEARKRWKDRNLGPRVPRPFGGKPGGDRPYGDKPGGPRRFDERPEGERSFRPKPFGDRPRGPKPFGSKPGGNRPFGGKPSGPGGPRPFGSKPGGDRPYGDKPRGPKPFGDKPAGKPFGSKPGGDRPSPNLGVTGPMARSPVATGHTATSLQGSPSGRSQVARVHMAQSPGVDAHSAGSLAVRANPGEDPAASQAALAASDSARDYVRIAALAAAGRLGRTRISTSHPSTLSSASIRSTDLRVFV